MTTEPDTPATPECEPDRAYRVQILARAPRDPADKLMDLLGQHDGVVSADGASWSATITATGPDVKAAANQGLLTILEAAMAAGMPSWPVTVLDARIQDDAVSDDDKHGIGYARRAEEQSYREEAAEREAGAGQQHAIARRRRVLDEWEAEFPEGDAPMPPRKQTDWRESAANSIRHLDVLDVVEDNDLFALCQALRKGLTPQQQRKVATDLLGGPHLRMMVFAYGEQEPTPRATALLPERQAREMLHAKVTLLPDHSDPGWKL